MKIFFCNIKPFIAYWVALAVWFIPAYMLDLSDTAWITVFVVALLIPNGITGYTDGVKEIRWGIALFGVQLAVCGALILVGEYVGAYTLRMFGVLGSAVVQMLFDFDYIATDPVAPPAIQIAVSVVVALVPFFIGWGIRRSVQKEKGSGQNYRTSTTGAHI